VTRRSEKIKRLSGWKTLNFNAVHLASKILSGRYSSSLLHSGYPASHRMDSLVLLPSGPDTVQNVLLRRTQTSTPLTRARPHKVSPQLRNSTLL